MKRILINATHNEEIRVALCKDNHLYDFDLENRTREQKKANIYKGHVTRVEPSLEAVFVEYGSARQGFLPLREIAPEYLKGNVRNDNIRELIKEGDEVIIQVEKEERGNKGAAVSTYISLAGRYLVLMPNNHKAGGISRQISGKVREEMKQIISSLSIPQGMSVIVRTAGIGKGFEDLQNDLNHLLDIWSSILEQNRTRPSPCLVHQEAGVVTRAVRDYLRDDIGEVWIDSENAYNEAANFIAAVMPNQMSKLRKYTDYEPLFTRFGIERQIETAYQREVRLPSGGSIVIDQTEAMVAIDINSAKSTKGSDVAETAYHTNLEAAEEIARQLRLRDMGGLIVIDFIDMADPRHQKDVEKRLIDATRYDRARVQFAEISKFGLMEMSRQRLRPSLEEATGYICPRCHGNGMIRDLRSLALSIMRQIEQIALKERMGEIQAEVPTEIAAFLLNEKRESLVYLEQDSGVRVTILPHAHLESPNFSLHFNPDGFAPSSYERIVDVEERESVALGYDTDWHTEVAEPAGKNRWQTAQSSQKEDKKSTPKPQSAQPQSKPQAVAWLSNLFAPKPQAKLAGSFGAQDVAAAIESIVNDGGVSLGAFGVVAPSEAVKPKAKKPTPKDQESHAERADKETRPNPNDKNRRTKVEKPTERADKVEKTEKPTQDKTERKYPKREVGSVREPRGEMVRGEVLTVDKPKSDNTKPIKAEKAEKTPRIEQTDKPKKVAPMAEKVEKAQKDPNELVLHIKPVSETPIASRTVHVSLDGSKPRVKKPSKPTDEVAVISTVVADDHVADETTQAPLAEVTLPVADEVVDVVAEPVAVESVAVSVVGVPVVPTVPVLPIDGGKLTQIALATGRAINDPRVVAMAFVAPAPIAITGTAGEFIKRVLGDDMTGDFVVDFLRAAAKFATSSDNAKHKYDFANYGYAPLSEQYLSEFVARISAVSWYAIAQGKTLVSPRPITRRADNDPRGQHPDFVAQTTSESDIVETNEIGATKVLEANETQATLEGFADEITANEIVTPDIEVVDETASMPTEEHVSVPTDELEQILEELPVDNLASSTLLDEVVDDLVDVDLNADQAKSKTNSYKDMIENVSDQLLQPTGILSLVAQKKPKSTKPKSKATKSPAKKTSKAAQKSQVVKVVKPKSDNDTLADTNGDTPA